MSVQISLLIKQFHLLIGGKSSQKPWSNYDFTKKIKKKTLNNTKRTKNLKLSIVDWLSTTQKKDINSAVFPVIVRNHKDQGQATKACYIPLSPIFQQSHQGSDPKLKPYCLPTSHCLVLELVLQDLWLIFEALNTKGENALIMYVWVYKYIYEFFFEILNFISLKHVKHKLLSIFYLKLLPRAARGGQQTRLGLFIFNTTHLFPI